MEKKKCKTVYSLAYADSVQKRMDYPI